MLAVRKRESAFYPEVFLKPQVSGASFPVIQKGEIIFAQGNDAEVVF